MVSLTLPEKHHVTPFLFGIALIPLCALFATGEYTYDPNPIIVLINSFNLIVHEAGHFFFRWFGQTIHAAGGTILQLALPALFVYQGVYWNNRVGTQLSLLWLGQSAVGVSIYAADAQARVLPLLGGDNVFHDWHTILGNLSLLEATPIVAGAFYGFAFVCWFVMLIAPKWIG
ncbi:hypothetical protein [Rubrivirga sp.]|uniref:hypothetical protein n=1 Tax=Rubrivirga sp. TaxID=1885344 RepID=UPI003C76C867